MKKIINLFYLIILLAGMLVSCKPDEPKPNVPSFKNGVFVLNEGAFGAGNAEVSFISHDSGTISHNHFELKNDRPLGDLLQSTYVLDNRYYFVVNNSKKIEVTDTSLKSVAVIEGLNSPRYFLPIGNNKAYISDISAGGIHIVDLGTHKVSGKVDFRGGQGMNSWVEQMVLHDNKVYAVAVNAGKILKIDVATNQVTDSADAGIDPQWIVKDKNGLMWTLSNRAWKGEASYLIAFDKDLKVVKDFEFPGSASGASFLKINNAGDVLYFNYNGLYKMNIADNSLPSGELVSTKVIYGFGIDPYNGNIYIGDAKDFASAGEVTVYDAAGKQLKKYTAGFLPKEFIFVK